MRHSQVLSIAGLLLAYHAPPGYAQTTAEPPAAALPVTGVTLYTSGVGYFERGGVVDGDATQTLLFPVGQMIFRREKLRCKVISLWHRMR